jgi:hypothetical protein
MTDRNYNLDFLPLVKALAGVSDFTDNEETSILAMANRRFREAYDLSLVWPRYLVAGEARTIDTDQIIPFTESGLTAIGEFIRIHRTEPFKNYSAAEYEFFVDSYGAHIQNIFNTSDVTAYVTYKKNWDGPYTTATTTIPDEFFYYAAHATYADFLRMDGQVDKAMAEEQNASNYLAIQLNKVETQRNNNIISRRISTHVSRQNRN